MYAVIETGGKQYKVQPGDVIFVEKLAVEENADITFDKVIAVGADDGIKVGKPYVEGATVSAKALKNGKNVMLEAKRSLCSRINPKRTKNAKKAIANPTPRLRLPQSTRNDDLRRLSFR